MTDNTKLMQRIRHLLAKAEGTDNEHEADAFMAKAQSLMTDSMITEAMLNAAKPHQSKEKPLQRAWQVANPYSTQKAQLLMHVIKAQGGKVVWQSPSRWDPSAKVFGIGFASDLELADNLYTHLLAQLVRQVMKVKPGPSDTVWSDKAWDYVTVSTRLYRANWCSGFANHVGMRLEEAAAARRAEATVEQGNGLALALIDRATEVGTLYDELYGHLGRGRRQSRSVSSTAGYGAGRQAGASADIGNRGVGGTRHALGS